MPDTGTIETCQATFVRDPEIAGRVVQKCFNSDQFYWCGSNAGAGIDTAVPVETFQAEQATNPELVANKRETSDLITMAEMPPAGRQNSGRR